MPSDLPFFAKQTKVVLSNSGLIDPERLEDYVARGGYLALAYALREMSPEDVCTEISKSGLRGRGGAGYPAGLKWDLVRKAPDDKKYVVANGDEGDPGAYMDRTLMESDPHRVLEGMAIAGYAVGADQGFHLRPRRVSRGCQAAGTRHPRGRAARPAGQPRAGQQLQLPHRHPHRRRRVRLRRGDGADGLASWAAAASLCRARPTPHRAASGATRR